MLDKGTFSKSHYNCKAIYFQTYISIGAYLYKDMNIFICCLAELNLFLIL